MSVEYFYENDLNMLYNAAVNNNPDGGEHHTKMLESYNNLVAYISHIEHWKSTALQLAKNYGVRIHSLEQRIAELEQERRWIPVSERLPEEGQTVSEALSQLTNKELAEKLISDVWGILKLFGEKSDLLTEVIERLFTLDTPDRVRCTKDGEYPEDDITVLAEFHGVDFADIPHIVWFEWDNAQWVDFLTEEFVPNVPEEMTVYWRPLTSLKDEYERQKDGE